MVVSGNNTLDLDTLNSMLNGIASQSVLEGVLHGKDGIKIDNDAINSRVQEALVFVASEFEAIKAQITALKAEIGQTETQIATSGRIIDDNT